MILSAGAIVVRKGEKGWLYLFLRAYKNWDFSKGVVEEGEQPFDTALRELEEETGITDVQFPWGRDFVETAPYGKGKVARYYLARTDTEKVELGVSPELGRPEHHEYRWVSYEELEKLVPARLRRVIQWVHERVEGNPQAG